MKNINLYRSKAFPPNKLNYYRSNSLAQKIRRDLLRLIIYQPNLEKEINILKKQIEELINKEFKNINELISYNFKDAFINNFYQNEKDILNRLNPTKESLEFIKIFEKINNPALSIFIHGSHADGKTTNFSDIDVSIFINNNSENLDLKRVRNDILILNNYSKKIDLETHHSIFLYYLNDINCYPESFMPLDVLIKSLTPKSQKFNFNNTRFSIDIAIDSFLRIFNTLSNLASKGNNNNFYKFKNIISSYFMLIILHYEILNFKFSDKKSIFMNLLSKENNEFTPTFTLCSEIREKWPLQNTSIDFGISNFLVQKILQHSKHMLQEIDESLSLKKTLEIILNS